MSRPLPRQLLPDTAEVDADGRLRVGGCDLLDLAAEHGTPLFVYDEAHLRARCREAVASFGDGVAYASKAFLCVAMARLAHEEGMHLDVATGGELHVALAEGRHRLAAARPKVGLVVDEQRRAVLLGQRDEVAAADGEAAVVADRRGGRQQPARERPRHHRGRPRVGTSSPGELVAAPRRRSAL